VQPTLDDATLVRYLLRELDPAEQAAIEDRYLTDGGLFEHLVLVEAELLDGHLRGSLPAEQSRRVQEVYSQSAAGREKLALARALAHRAASARVASDPAAMSPAPPPPIVSWWSTVAARAAAGLFVLVAGIWLWLAPPTPPTNPADPASTTPPVRLLPGLTRSVAAAVTVTLPATATTLDLELEVAVAGRYRAVLEGVAGEVRWEGPPRSARLITGGLAIAVSIPRGALSAGDHVLRLEEVSGDGGSSQEYFFRLLEPAPAP
jgi:hypothetical protein